MIKTLGFALAAALLFSFPAAAAVSAVFEAGQTVQVVSDDCLVLPTSIEAKFFVEADQGCDVTLADLADVCLVETTSAPPARIAVIFLPNEPLGCTAIRPSPPG